MSYIDFSFESIAKILEVSNQPADLFPALEPMPVPPWLRSLLDRGRRQVLTSEKARSEFIVVPILLAAQEQCGEEITIYSGQRLDVDPERGLVGECDFILSKATLLPALRAPLVAIVEAKKHDIEGGIWQCVAQMVGARVFNERSEQKVDEVFGCVTNGESWQFLRLAGRVAAIDRRRYYINDVADILGVFAVILGSVEAAGVSI